MFNIRNFGYLKPSRIYNTDTFRHKQKDDFYISQKNNMYAVTDYRNVVTALCSGKTIYTANRVDRLYVDAIREKNEKKQKQLEGRAKKAKRRI